MEKKIPFIKKFILSIKDLDKYYLLVSEKVTRAIIYLLELMLIFSIILSAFMTYKTNEVINESCKFAKDNIPNFSITSEGLKTEEESFILDTPKNIGIKLIFDSTKENEDDYKEIIEEYDGNSLLLLKNKAMLVSGENKMELSYQEMKETMGIEEISKDSLISIFEQNRVQIMLGIYFSMLIATYLMYTISALIDALALSLLVIIISKMAKIQLKYSQAVTIGISSLTLPIVINLIYCIANMLNGFYMPYFQIMYTLISYIYVVAVILIMKSDLIKKKQLIKATIEIKELQKNLEPKENKEEKKEKPEEKEKKEDEKKDKSLGDVKKRVKDKLDKDKDHPEPQANIEGGK